MLGLLAVVGCNSGRQLQTDLYQRELRLQEDEIYRLEDCLEEYQAIIRDYRCELAELKQDRAAGAAEPARAERVEPIEPEPRLAPEPLPEAPEPLDLDSMPVIETPDTSMPAIDSPDPTGTGLKGAIDEAPPFNGASRAPSDPEQGRLVSAETTAEPSRLVQQALANGPPATPPNPYPHTNDATPLRPVIAPVVGVDNTLVLSATDDGGTLLVVVEGAEDHTLGDFEGEVSVMLTDPTIEGGRRRIARWDFSGSEVSQAWRYERGVPRLELPIALPGEAPTTQPLRLWVRLVDGDRRRLQATPLSLSDTGSLRRVANSAPRLLPGTNDSPRSVAKATPERSTGGEWRPARRRDRTVMTASFESPLD